MRGPLAEYYRYYPLDSKGNAIDVDADLAEIANWIATNGKKAGIYEEECRFSLRKIWEFLIQNFALGQAWRLGKVLALKHERWVQRLVRGLGYLYPRLAIAIQVGCFVELGSSDLLRLLKLLATQCWPAYTAVFLVFAFVVGGLKVEQRVGHESTRRLLGKSTVLFAIGLIHGALVFSCHSFLRWTLGLRWDGRFALLCAAAALYLGFVFQLMWQERPIGAPADSA